MDIHETARTTPHSRMLIVQRLAEGWSVAAVAAAQGVTGLLDRTSERHRSPTELAAALSRAGYEPVSFGAPDELVPGTTDLTGTDLPTTIANIAACEHVIANDSGLMHIADALGVKVTAIFGPTSVIKNGPLAPTSRVVASDKVCAPCQFAPDRFARCQCIGEIELATVLASLQHDLAGLEPQAAAEAPRSVQPRKAGRKAVAGKAPAL